MMPSSRHDAFAQEAGRRAGSAAALPAARKTVLCVDDEPGILAALKRVLRAYLLDISD